MAVIAVVGGQWGDEGKGKIIDLLAGDAHMVIRAQGGNNAGHTVINPQGRFALHLVPAGIFNPATTCVIGAGVALNVPALLQELAALHARGVRTDRLVISPRAHLVMPYHPLLDRAEEAARGNGRIGTTGRGIGPTYVDKVARVGLRAGDLLEPEVFREKLGFVLERKRAALAGLEGVELPSADALAAEYRGYAAQLGNYIRETVGLVADAVAAGELLDLDYGTYPYVTASSPTVAGLCLGAGIGPTRLTTAIGVFKAYQTRVGGGPFPTELHDAVADEIRDRGQEYGTTTGRPRRCGWFDAVAARYAMALNGFTGIALTRLDILDTQPEVKICVAYELDGSRVEALPSSTSALARCRPIYEVLPGWQQPTSHVRRYEDLPAAARVYVERIEQLLACPVQIIGVGAERDETIVRHRPA